jgi:hypothetical protein
MFEQKKKEMEEVAILIIEESSIDSDIAKLKKKKGKQKQKVDVFLVYFSFLEKAITNKGAM